MSAGGGPLRPASTRLWGVGVVAILAGIATMSGVLLLAFAIFTALVIAPAGTP